MMDAYRSIPVLDKQGIGEGEDDGEGEGEDDGEGEGESRPQLLGPGHGPGPMSMGNR